MANLVWLAIGLVGGIGFAALAGRSRLRSVEKRATAALAETADSRHYLDTLVSHIPDGVVVVDEDWTVVQVNDAYCRMTGRSRDELIGLRPPYPGWAPEERERMQSRISAHSRFAGTESFTMAYVRPDEKRLTVMCTPGGRFRSKSGREYFFAIMKDVTQQKEYEEKLRESEAMFRRIADTSVDAIYQLDLNGVFTYCSPAVVKILGYTADEVMGTNFRSYFLPDELPVAQDAFFRSINGEDIKHLEMRARNKEGKPVPIEISATPVFKDGRIVGSQGIGRDVTSRTLAEKSLRASEARFRTVIESVPFDLLLIDEDGRYALQNSASRALWGDIVGKRPEDIAEEATSLALWLENNRRAFAGEIVEGEVSYGVKGEQRHCYNIIAPVYDMGKVRSVLVVNVDITERKLAEKALSDSEQKYRFLVENSGIAVSLWDREGRLMVINRIAARYLGSTPESLIGQSCHDFLPKQYADRLLERLRVVWDTGASLQTESDFQTATDQRWFRSYFHVVTDAQGKPFGVQLVAHDITELTQAERSLRDRDTRLRLMVAQVPAVLWTVDRDLRFTSSLGAGLRALELSPGQVVGTSLSEYFQTDDPEYLPIAMHRRSLQGEATTYEFTWNETIWETHTEPLRNEAGEIIGCLALALDISERKRAEKVLRQSSQEMRALAGRLQKVREEESTNIAREIHDELGQALTGLVYQLDYVRRRLPQCGDQEKRAKIDQKIKEMNLEIAATINAMRELATRLRPKIFDDRNCVEAIEFLAEDFQKRTGIRCDLIQDGIETSSVTLDPERSTAVCRIVQEALLNVRRHAAATRVWVELRRDEQSFVLEVRDNGRGIPPAKLKNLEGLGVLGMRERALVFGGTVAIRSDPGQGTRVEVRIPLTDDRLA
jgi:PAS domain S-box-containing protein